MYQTVVQRLDAELLAKHRSLIDKFLEIAERKVSIIDDYGDENWDLLEKEVQRCILKIAKIEGDERFRDVNGDWCFGWFELPHVDSKGAHFGWLK